MIFLYVLHLRYPRFQACTFFFGSSQDQQSDTVLMPAFIKHQLYTELYTI